MFDAEGVRPATASTPGVFGTEEEEEARAYCMPFFGLRYPLRAEGEGSERSMSMEDSMLVANILGTAAALWGSELVSWKRKVHTDGFFF